MCSGTPHITLFGLSFVHLAIFSKRRKKANFAKKTGAKTIRTAMDGFHTREKINNYGYGNKAQKGQLQRRRI
jgi:hypothetical protein